MKYPFAATVQNQPYGEEKLSLIEAAHKAGLKVIGSMPLNQGEGFREASLEEMVSLAVKMWPISRKYWISVTKYD